MILLLAAALAAAPPSTAAVATDEAASQTEIDDGADTVFAEFVLGDTHTPDEDGGFRIADLLPEGAHLGFGDTRK